jgi:hypothetical protein
MCFIPSSHWFNATMKTCLCVYYQIQTWVWIIWPLRPMDNMYGHDSIINYQMLWGENTIKGAKGPKVKAFFQNYPWHVSFLCWFIISNFVFWIFISTLHLKYKYILTTIWFYICILCIHALYHINMNNLLCD